MCECDQVIAALAANVEHQQKESSLCGFCMQSVEDPRVLPCGHIHCYSCLVGYFETNKIVRCGTCREAFDVTLARLPSASTEITNVQYCNSCIEKGKSNILAQSYCTTCNRKMCHYHKTVHEDFLPKHRYVIDIEEYIQNVKKLEVRYCRVHEDMEASMGCMSCYSTLCVACMDLTSLCASGAAHQPVYLKQLVNELKLHKDVMGQKASVKEKELSALLKRCTEILSGYEIKTEEMIKLLHDTRDEQLAEIRIKYNKLEKDLTESRRRTRNEILEFMEREIGVRLTEINTLVSLQNLTFRDSHQADILESFAQTANEIKELVEERLPSLSVNQMRLRTQADDPAMKIALVEGPPIRINSTPYPSISLSLKHSVNGEMCPSVTSYQGITFISSNNQILKINGIDFKCSIFLKHDRHLFCVSAYKGRLYALTYLHGYRVHVYNMMGQEITSWQHADMLAHRNKLTVTADKVVVPDRLNKRLAVYSLEGQLLKHIPCLLDDTCGDTAICAADSESVIVSSTTTSTVFRVNIDSGEVMWTCTQVNRPEGVACIVGNCTLVAASNSPDIRMFVLDTTTGNLLYEVFHPRLKGNLGVLDMHVSDTNLTVTTQVEEAALLCFELLCDL